MLDRYRIDRKVAINKPVTTIMLKRFGDHLFKGASACMQGMRAHMEDAHNVSLDMEDHQAAFFGIFDGHDGQAASAWCAENLELYMNNLDVFNEENIIGACMEADSAFLENTDVASHGSTAVMVIVEPQNNEYVVTVINIGDSRCILCKKSERKFVPMTVDHKPTDETEKNRIVNAGGFVARGRVDSYLSVSRAFGDIGFKNAPNVPMDQQRVIAVPDITHEKLEEGDYIFLSCDGVFEVFNEETIIEYLLERLSNEMDVGEILEELLNEAIKLGSKDNLTAILVQVTDGTDYTRVEYIPGEYLQKGNKTYVSAYKEFSELCGYTLEETQELWKSRN